MRIPRASSSTLLLIQRQIFFQAPGLKEKRLASSQIMSAVDSGISFEASAPDNNADTINGGKTNQSFAMDEKA